MSSMIVPVFFARYVFNDSFKLTFIAFLIGIMELRIGIRIPIRRACVDAYQLGQIVGLKPN